MDSNKEPPCTKRTGLLLAALLLMLLGAYLVLGYLYFTFVAVPFAFAPDPWSNGWITTLFRPLLVLYHLGVRPPIIFPVLGAIVLGAGITFLCKCLPRRRVSGFPVQPPPPAHQIEAPTGPRENSQG